MIDDELRALTSVEPSADFTARIRERIRVDKPRHWVPPAMFAIAALILMTVIVTVPRVMRNDVEPQPFTTLPASLIVAEIVPHQHIIAAARPERSPRVSPRPLEKTRDATVSEITAATVQIDPAELRALQQLFASSLDVPLELPATQAGAITIEAVSIEPLRFEPITEGAR